MPSLAIWTAAIIFAIGLIWNAALKSARITSLTKDVEGIDERLKEIEAIADSRGERLGKVEGIASRNREDILDLKKGRSRIDRAVQALALRLERLRHREEDDE